MVQNILQFAFSKENNFLVVKQFQGVSFVGFKRMDG